MPFIKGQSGNPTGKPKNQGIALLARAMTPLAMRRLKRILMDDKVPPAAHVSAIGLVLDRGYGKAPAFNTNSAETFKKAIDLTDDELATIVAQANVIPMKKIA